jgi:ATP-dependent DNA helicase DinG
VTWSCVRVPMSFPVEGRRVWATPIASMTHKNKAQAYPLMAQGVRGLLAHHADERVLIHTVSYDLAGHLMKSLLSTLGPARKRLMTYRDARDRDAVIERYRRTEGAVLVAPSLERGVDFKGDDCRVVVVCKVPYPNLGDKQVGARFHSKGGRTWYSVQTVRSLVQMTGRGTRSEDDFSTSYVLDKQFVENVWRKSKQLLPTWWADAVDMSGQWVRPFLKAGEVGGRAA